MVHFERISQIIGISSIDQLKAAEYQKKILPKKNIFTEELTNWVHENIVCVSEPILNDGYYEALVSPEYGIDFYKSLYDQALTWLKLGFSFSHIL